jgi:hypothetical protein
MSDTIVSIIGSILIAVYAITGVFVIKKLRKDLNNRMAYIAYLKRKLLRPALADRLYVNPHGILTYDFVLYNWQMCSPVEGIEETEMFPGSFPGQRPDAVVITLTGRKRPIRLDLLTSHE